MIKFSKGEEVRFVGHLDLLRTLQRVIIRADLNVKYSQGFNRHPIMSIANPLMLGATSNCEFIDIEFNDDIDVSKIVENMNNATVPGIKFLGILEIERKENSTSFIEYAKYILKVPNDFDFKKEDYLNRDEINILKKTKNGEKIFNIKDKIISIETEKTKDELIFTVVLKSGNEDNVKPALFMKTVYEFYNKEFIEYKMDIHRENLMDANFKDII